MKLIIKKYGNSVFSFMCRLQNKFWFNLAIHCLIRNINKTSLCSISIHSKIQCCKCDITPEHINTIDSLIQSYNIICLLIDARELRWLPSLLTLAYSWLATQLSMKYAWCKLMRTIFFIWNYFCLLSSATTLLR